MSLNEITKELKKLAASDQDSLKDVKEALMKLAENRTEEKAKNTEAEALIKKAIFGFDEEDDSEKNDVIDLIRRYIAENPDVAAALGIGAAGAGLGGLAGGLMGGDPTSALLGAAGGGLAGGLGGFYGGEDLMSAFAGANNDFTAELIKKAAKEGALDNVNEELVKQAAWEDALKEVKEELVKEAAAQKGNMEKNAANEQLLNAIRENLIKKAAMNDAINEVKGELEKEAALKEILKSIIANKK